MANRKLILLLFILTFFSCVNVDFPKESDIWEGFQVDTRDEAIFDIDDYRIFNNVTGKYNQEYSGTYEQSIYKGEGVNSGSFGWEWSQSGEAITPFYPEVIYGWNPWWTQSTTTVLPKLWSRGEDIILTIDYDFEASGRYNTALDIWLCSEAVPIPPGKANSNTIVELMIWFEHTETQGFPVTDTVKVGDETWDLYFIEGIPSYIAFLSKSQSFSKNLNIKEFLIYLEDNGYISSGLYLSAIEFGNEIWSGSGYMKVNDYNINFNDW